MKENLEFHKNKDKTLDERLEKIIFLDIFGEDSKFYPTFHEIGYTDGNI